MAILQLCKFFPLDWGGMETVAYNLLRGLGSLGVENDVIAFGPQDRTEHIRVSGVTSLVYRLPALPGVGRRVPTRHRR